MIRKLFFCVFIILLSSSYMYAQGKVSGTVSDNSEPLPEANVIVKGISSGTTTDFDKNYTISIPSNEAILEISFLGYTTTKVPVGYQLILNITIEEDAESLDEIVVKVLGGMEYIDNIALDRVVLRKIIEERYVTGFTTYMAFNDARRLLKFDSDVIVSVPLNTTTTTTTTTIITTVNPQRLLYPQDEIDGSCNISNPIPNLFDNSYKSII